MGTLGWCLISWDWQRKVVTRKKSVSLIDCVSQSGQVPRCPELGNSRGRNWGSWRLESGKQSVRNGMEVYISA